LEDEHKINVRIYVARKRRLAFTGFMICAILLGTAAGLSKTDPLPPWQFGRLWQAITVGPFVYRPEKQLFI
jgi:hypothetical protein